MRAPGARLVWLVVLDDVLSVLISWLAPGTLVATRLCLSATTLAWAGLVAPPRLVLAHLVVSVAAGWPLVATAPQPVDAAAAALVTLVLLPVLVQALRATGAADRARLRRTAEHDQLTGLLNRHGLATWAAGLGPVTLSVLVLDLDGLRSLNAAAGHAGGDAALRGIADALAAQRRDGQAAVRWGGDEFVFADADPGAGPPPEMAERVFAAALAAAVECGTSVSAGFASGPLEAPDHFGSLVDRADRALLRAKVEGGSRLVGVG